MIQRRLFVISALFGISLGVLGCQSSLRHRPRDGQSPIVWPDKSVVIFFVDGLDRDRLQKMVEAGRLPNIKSRFIDGGMSVTSAVTCIPSITYPNTVSLLTGTFPGHHGILGNRWFDRQTLAFRDYSSASTFRNANPDFRAETLYEILHDRFTVNVQCHTRRGVTHTIDNTLLSGIAWGLQRFSDVDRRVGNIGRVIDVAEDVGRWPVLLMHYFPGIDEIGHRHGSNSHQYADALVTVDRAIGRVCDGIDRLGLNDRTYLILLSDHGHIPTGPDQTFDIVRWLRNDVELSVFDGIVLDKSYAVRFSKLDDYEAVLINSAHRRCALHLRGRRGWAYPIEPEEVEALLSSPLDLISFPAVDLIARRAGPDRVRISSRQGSAVIERRHEGTAALYRLVIEHGDCLLDAPNPNLAAFVAHGWYDSRAWLEATAATAYPDFVPQIVEMFDSPRSGDVVFFAADHWAFKKGDPGGHGSCLAQDMCIPLYFTGPDIPAGGSIPTGRLVDVVPTVLELLGEQHRLEGRPTLDGLSLAQSLKDASVER